MNTHGRIYLGGPLFTLFSLESIFNSLYSLFTFTYMMWTNSHTPCQSTQTEIIQNVTSQPPLGLCNVFCCNQVVGILIIWFPARNITIIVGFRLQNDVNNNPSMVYACTRKTENDSRTDSSEGVLLAFHFLFYHKLIHRILTYVF